jgi:hypothetical protein
MTMMMMITTTVVVVVAQAPGHLLESRVMEGMPTEKDDEPLMRPRDSCDRAGKGQLIDSNAMAANNNNSMMTAIMIIMIII